MNEISLIKNLFDVGGEFEASLMCTYNLNLNFLENYLLDLNALNSNRSLSIFTDPSTYDNLLEDKPRWINNKYLVTRVSSHNVFHSKIYLIASKDKSLFAIGSANLTREGLTSNLELLSIFEVSKEQPKYYRLLRDVIDYFKKLAELSGSITAQEKVNNVEELCSDYTSKDINKQPHFMHNIEHSIMDGIRNNLKGEKPTSIQIISPFYDSALVPITVLSNEYPDASVEVIVQQGKSNFPINKYAELKKEIKVFIYKNIDRYIHGKSIIFNFKNKRILYMGSANCTRAGLMENIGHGNFEVGLIGEISEDTKTKIMNPQGIPPLSLDNISDLLVTKFKDDMPNNINHAINYILQAEKVGDNIEITVDEEINKKFRPKTLIASNAIESKSISLTPKTQSKFIVSYSKDLENIKEPFLVKIIGEDESGNNLESNISWIINLETNSKDIFRAKYPKIYNDPFEFDNFVREMVGQNDIEELINFLIAFDIPIDLVLPPHFHKGVVSGKTPINKVGILPPQKLLMFTGNEIIDHYRNFLERLLSKLLKHLENPQKEKIHNFIYIISILFSMIKFININKFEKYRNTKVISPDDWFEIRAYYNLLLKYLDISWSLLWFDNSYSKQISYQISLENDVMNDSSINNFEDYIIVNEYDSIKELADIAFMTFDNFISIQKEKEVNAGKYGFVKPKLFEGSYVYLNQIDEIRNKFLSVMEKLSNYKKIDKTLV